MREESFPTPPLLVCPKLERRQLFLLSVERRQKGGKGCSCQGLSSLNRHSDRQLAEWAELQASSERGPLTSEAVGGKGGSPPL